MRKNLSFFTKNTKKICEFVFYCKITKFNRIFVAIRFLIYFYNYKPYIFMFEDFKNIETAAQAAEKARKSAEVHAEALKTYQKDKTAELDDHKKHCFATIEIAQTILNVSAQKDEEVEIILKVSSEAAVKMRNAQGQNLNFGESGVGTIRIKLSDLQKLPNFSEFKPLLDAMLGNFQQLSEGVRNVNGNALNKMVQTADKTIPTVPAIFHAS